MMVNGYDEASGPPMCERCGEPCHWCENDFEDGDDGQS